MRKVYYLEGTDDMEGMIFATCSSKEIAEKAHDILLEDLNEGETDPDNMCDPYTVVEGNLPMDCIGLNDELIDIGDVLIRENAKSDLPDMTDKEFKKKCYELYQLDWMKAHSCSISDIFSVLREGFISMTMNDDIDMDANLASDQLEEYFFEQGFHGELFAGFAEFLSCEYQDREYMKKLLSNKQLYALYLNKIAKGGFRQ